MSILNKSVTNKEISEDNSMIVFEEKQKGEVK